jgi:3-methylcrotonyl-CoA carboxylase alpha subunit
MFSSLLIANRGEIACRVIRTARRMGLRTISVYSEADKTSLHATEADEAYEIGPAEAQLSYLNGTRILDVAASTGADAIHPGYGFLSENAAFAEACETRGIIFVGPSPGAIRSMGLKDEAKAIASAAGVPVIPGYDGGDRSVARLMRGAEDIGYPVIIKAIAGGGGRGMRIVANAAEFTAALEACCREAKAAFGDGRVLLEKYFPSARHVEVQVIADAHGGVLHLFERDCSIQRRHQKIIEEAPAYDIPEQVREAMRAAAVAVARSVRYRNAGTVEFLYDPRTHGFFFMEMNTRLQVEHPVTEMITGLDLVELQLLVAAGERLPMGQDRIEANGHAVEARLYAEDPAQDFLPQTGLVHELVWPSGVEGARIDSGIAKGSEIGSFYDSMIAKIITWAPTRTEAITRLHRAVQGTFLFGLRTNKGFLLSVLNDPSFAEKAPTTRFLDQFGADAGKPPADILAVGCACWCYRQASGVDGPWGMKSGWTLAGGGRRERHSLSAHGQVIDFTIGYEAQALSFELMNRRLKVQVLSCEAQTLRLLVDGTRAQARFHSSGSQLFVDLDGHHLTLSEPDYAHMIGGAPGEDSVLAPMPGRVSKIEVANGAPVQMGDRLLVLEAMKMEHVLRAPVAGSVADISIAEGQQVREGDRLCTIVPELK